MLNNRDYNFDQNNCDFCHNRAALLEVMTVFFGGFKPARKLF